MGMGGRFDKLLYHSTYMHALAMGVGRYPLVLRLGQHGGVGAIVGYIGLSS